jgi:hypothetical protein
MTMWQKARIIDVDDNPEFLHLLGREVWTKCGISRDYLFQTYDGVLTSGDGHEINVLFEEGRDTLVSEPSRCLELLPEFAEDVPLISWQSFLDAVESDPCKSK